jgi:hypothetical protein
MLADTVEELHEFAARLGLKRAWYQPVSTPHYDLTATRRARAIHLGALEADRVGVVRIVRRYRAGAA